MQKRNAWQNRQANTSAEMINDLREKLKQANRKIYEISHPGGCLEVVQPAILFSTNDDREDDYLYKTIFQLKEEVSSLKVENRNLSSKLESKDQEINLLKMEKQTKLDQAHKEFKKLKRKYKGLKKETKTQRILLEEKKEKQQ